MATDQEDSRRVRKRKLRRKRSNEIERTWIDWMEAHAPYKPGDLTTVPDRKKKRGKKS